MSGMVRPFDARVIRADLARTHVRPLVDSTLTAGTTGRAPVGKVDESAYLAPGRGLFVYRLRKDDEDHLGVVADVTAEAFVDGCVRGHEAVHPARVAALVDHFTATTRRTELVTLLHHRLPGFEEAIAATLADEPVGVFTGADGWEQAVWRLPERLESALVEGLSGVVHYVADGHHRVAASLDIWERAGRPADVALLCVLYPLDGLRLRAFDRRVVGPVDPGRLRTLLASAFEVREVGDPQAAEDDLRVYVEGRWLGASRRGERAAGVAGLDITALDRDVLVPLLGDDADRIEITPSIPSLADLARACDADGGAAFALRPPTLDQLTAVADRGEVMPPKTTYFAPKPYAGVIWR